MKTIRFLDLRAPTFGDFFLVTRDSQRPADDGGVIDDMFGGDARPYQDRRGRPKLKRINELRDRVAVLAASGMVYEEIAAAIGCSMPTLTKYFFKELTSGKARKTADMVAKLYEQGIAGSVPAAKAFLQMALKADALPPPKQPKEQRVGKKEARLLESQTAHEGSGWGELLH